MRVQYLTLCLAGGALAMDMSHEVGASDDDAAPAVASSSVSSSSSSASASFSPVPHVPHNHHGVPILETHLLPQEKAYWEAYNTTTFFNVKSNKPALGAHVVLLALSTIFFYPICLVLNNVGSKWYLPILTVNHAMLAGSIFALAVFGASVEDMYPKNAYSRMSGILLVVLVVHFFVAVVHYGVKYLTEEDAAEDDYIPMKSYSHTREGSSLSPSSTVYDFNEASHNRVKSISIDSPRMSGAVSEQTLNRINESRIDEYDDENEEFAGLVEPKNRAFKSVSLKRDSVFDKIFHYKALQYAMKKFGALASIMFSLMNYPLFGYLMVYCMTGLAVGNMMGQGKKVFNLLAHFIKGGVFFVLGLVSLARYCGCLDGFGFAWNIVKFKADEKRSHKSWLIKYSPMKGTITMEFIESFLIFFYGSTNVFMEHLANPGGEWAAKDLQHVSIAFIYIGSGLCGLLTEFGLSEWRFRKVMEYQDNNRHPAKQVQYATPGYSPNPFPAFTIFWTGILMSQHAQASMTSTTIHTQWGYMLAYGAIVRGLTYLLCMFTSSSDHFRPLKPFTELVVAACLLSGGMIFMESTDQVVEALEWRGLTPMFTLNVSIGVCSLLMGWEMTLLFWRSWMKK